MFFRGPSEIVADFGCGEAVIAQSVQNTVYSFDLVAKNKHVTACNMAKVGASKQSDSWELTSLGLLFVNCRGMSQLLAHSFYPHRCNTFQLLIKAACYTVTRNNN